MTTLSATQENVTADLAQASAGLLGRLLDWMINALDAYFGLAGKAFPANHGPEEYHISDACSCG